MTGASASQATSPRAASDYCLPLNTLSLSSPAPPTCPASSSHTSSACHAWTHKQNRQIHKHTNTDTPKDTMAKPSTPHLNTKYTHCLLLSKPCKKDREARTLSKHQTTGDRHIWRQGCRACDTQVDSTAQMALIILPGLLLRGSWETTGLSAWHVHCSARYKVGRG